MPATAIVIPYLPMSSRPASPMLSSLGIVALAGAITPIACRDEGNSPAPIDDVGDVLDVYDDFYAFFCECYGDLYYADTGSGDECLSQLEIISPEERACLTEVYDQNPAAFDVLVCQAEALRELLSCERTNGCPGMFTCGDGTSVPEAWVCNGGTDCEDGSDEEQGCPPPFTCDEGLEVSEFSICDGFPDCVDGTDEADCPEPFTCGDGTEIPASWVCDGSSNCEDGSDEQQSCPVTCESQYESRTGSCGSVSDAVQLETERCFDYTCVDGTEIPGAQRCDGNPDCPDGDDETSCSSSGADGG